MVGKRVDICGWLQLHYLRPGGDKKWRGCEIVGERVDIYVSGDGYLRPGGIRNGRGCEMDGLISVDRYLRPGGDNKWDRL